MIARIAVWEPLPDEDRQWMLDTVKAVPGVIDAHYLLDPATGNGMTLSFYEDDVDLAAVRAAVDERAAEIGWHNEPRARATSETIYQVVRSARPRPDVT